MQSIRKQDMVGLDFETYGAVSLPDHGLERYVSDASFLPLIGSTYTNLGGIYRRRHQLFDGRDQDIFAKRIEGKYVVAHNAGFEQRVLQWMKLDHLVEGYIDSAVLARAMGAAGKLEAAAPQLLDADKLEDGWRLIKLFSIPSEEQLEAGDREFDMNLVVKHAEDWELFHHYCDLDAELSFRLMLLAQSNGFMTDHELVNQSITMEMNQRGWPVDVELVEEMQRRYIENQQAALENFRTSGDDTKDLNLNSLKQMKEFCAERGVRTSSFDEKNVSRVLVKVKEKLDQADAGSITLKVDQYVGYSQVQHMLETKQILGGSSLKKLKTILDTTSEDGRLRDQYLHIGAGQTWRTTGRSVQMQNLKRLSANIDNVDELVDPTVDRDNEWLGRNLRQVFTSSRPDGRLIVGDFSSVESRGLAWLAGAEWKLNEYRRGRDMYKVLAMQKFGVSYDQVDKAQRQFGKVGELSCGYQAGPDAVKSFAEGMGVQLTQAEAADIVTDWRGINGEVVDLWSRLDLMMWRAFASNLPEAAVIGGPRAWTVAAWMQNAPRSLDKIHPGVKSMVVAVQRADGTEMFRRIFHGVYERGRSLCFYKPTDRKTGPVWVNHFKDPKTKQVKFYSIYGGKLAGILTQSFCRELFFEALQSVASWTEGVENIDLIGQFHDEIVLDWWPRLGFVTHNDAMGTFEYHMTQCSVPGFPMAAEVKSDYRYTK